MRRFSLLLVPGLIAAGLFTGGPAGAQTEPVPVEPGPITVRAGYGEADATWHVGAGAGQYSGTAPQENTNAIGNGEVDPHGHSVKQRNSYGVQSRLSYRAIVVEDAEGDQVAFVKSDSYLAQDYLTRRVGQILTLERSGVSYDEIFHMASHNHSSPYYMTPSWGVWVFQDAFDIRAFEYHARAMADAIMAAENSMVPAQMGATTVDHRLFKGMIQRKTLADDGTPGGYPDDFGDFGLSVIRFDSLKDPANPEPLATMINWGQHPEGLDGHDLISGDFVASLERFVERDTGAPLVFGQGDVGSAEAGPGHPELVAELGIPARWSHAGHAQAERGAFLLSRDVKVAWDQIATGTPLVPFSADFDVAAGNAFVPGPYSHPYPSVSNCRTESTANGSSGVPVLGLPDCFRDGPDHPFGGPAGQLWAALKDAGVPVPEHYDAPAFTGVEENLRLKLQAFKMGEVILASCACEAQVDIILNFETRANETQDDIWEGFDWTDVMDCTNDDAGGDWTCTKPADYPRPRALLGTHTFTDYEYRRMQAQIHNDAAGWDLPQNAVFANAEPKDPEKIWGNFTDQELPAAYGYKLAIGVGHASDYNGYTVSYREYMGYDEYRKALTSYGAHTADYMATRLVRLAGKLNGAPQATVDPFGTEELARGLPDEARQVAFSTALGAASMTAYEAWRAAIPNDKGPAEALEQPRSITRFDATTFSWRGGSNAVDNPTVTIEQLVDGEWEPYAHQDGEVQTRVRFPTGVNALTDTYTGNQEWKWTANFEAFNSLPEEIGSTPAGIYRFSVDGRIRRDGQDRPYRLKSARFTVSPWDGVQVTDMRPAEDGSLSFVATSDYPDTYPAGTPRFPYVNGETKSDELGKTFCTRCSFRPWASSGEVERVVVTVTREDTTTEQIEAQRGEDGRWYAPTNLYIGDRAQVASGSAVDNYGETNSQPSATVEGDRERPPAEPKETVLSLTVSGKGANRVLTATLRELDSGAPVVDREVLFYANSNLIGSARTSTDGVATFKAPPGYRGDSFSFQAVFQGDDSFRASSSSAAT